jgi:putative transcriptional regulator
MTKTIKNTVHAWRIKKNITQECLAEAVGVSRQTIIAIEKGNYTPSLMLAFMLARYFKISLESLFSYE